MKSKKPIAIFIFLLLIILVLIAVIAYFTGKKEESLTDKNSVAVYFVRTRDTDYKLAPVRRKIYEKENKLKVAIGELLRGPDKNEKNSGYYSEIPKETELIELKETPDRITINFSSEFEAGGGSASMTARLKQVINTSLDSAKTKPIYLQIDGENVKSLGGEGIMVPRPLSRNLNRGQNL